MVVMVCTQDGGSLRVSVAVGVVAVVAVSALTTAVLSRICWCVLRVGGVLDVMRRVCASCSMSVGRSDSRR